tara:strand:+ start:130 stop:543 length:414 start_codon:yes stop_codon:yes gene_type:complete
MSIPQPNSYRASTLDIDVEVEPFFMEQESTPEASIYVWGYKVMIHNRRAKSVKLQSRYWKITDGLGQTQEVHGEGVIGKQPQISPGQKFEYTSGAPLPTPSGIMYGHYTVIEETGDIFDINIPAFSLDSPFQKQTLN